MSANQYVESNLPGISVTTTVSVDWADLGHELGQMSSDTQAALLHGFVEGLHVDPGTVHLQLAFIAETIQRETENRPAERAKIADVLRGIAAAIAEGIDG